ncbi:hypothetical protein ACMFMG_004532 [Clarireedia jacksonii]
MYISKILAVFSLLAVAGLCVPLAPRGFNVFYDTEYEPSIDGEGGLSRRGVGMVVEERGEEKGAGFFADEKRAEDKGTGFFADEKRKVDGRAYFSPDEKGGAHRGNAANIYLPARE